MHISWNSVVDAISLGMSKAGIHILRSRIQESIDPDGDALTNLLATLVDQELERIENDLQKGLGRTLKKVLS